MLAMHEELCVSPLGHTRKAGTVTCKYKPSAEEAMAGKALECVCLSSGLYENPI